MSSVRGPQNLANSRAKTPQIACACASPSPGRHASRLSAGGWRSSPRSSRSTSCWRSRGTRARMSPVNSLVGSSTTPPIPARIASSVMFNSSVLLPRPVGPRTWVCWSSARGSTRTSRSNPEWSLRPNSSPREGACATGAARRAGASANETGASALSSGSATSAAASSLLNSNRGRIAGRHRSSRRAQNGSRPRRSPPSSWYWPNPASTPPSRPRARRRLAAHAPARIVAASIGAEAFASIARARSSANGSATRVAAGRPIGCGEPGVSASSTPPTAEPKPSSALSEVLD